MSEDSSQSTSGQAPAAGLPQEPAPVPVVPDITKEQIVSDLLGQSPTVATVVPPEEKKHTSAPIPKGKSKFKGAVLAALAVLLLTIPVAVYFISQQNQSIADIRNWATGTNCGPYSSNAVNGYCDPGEGDACDSDSDCAGNQICHCQGGQTCSYSVCVSESYFVTACTGDGREPSHNSENEGSWTCCAEGYEAGPGQDGCYPSTTGGGGDDTAGGDTTGDDDDTTVPTATPTTGVNPICQNIKIYKGGTQVTDLTSLRAGDEVVLAVKGNLAPTKAHFRVNGSAWTETTTQNSSNEFTLAYTIPAGVTDFVFEGEVFTNGAWH